MQAIVPSREVGESASEKAAEWSQGIADVVDKVVDAPSDHCRWVPYHQVIKIASAGGRHRRGVSGVFNFGEYYLPDDHALKKLEGTQTYSLNGHDSASPSAKKFITHFARSYGEQLYNDLTARSGKWKEVMICCDAIVSVEAEVRVCSENIADWAKAMCTTKGPLARINNFTVHGKTRSLSDTRRRRHMCAFNGRRRHAFDRALLSFPTGLRTLKPNCDAVAARFGTFLKADAELELSAFGLMAL